MPFLYSWLFVDALGMPNLLDTRDSGVKNQKAENAGEKPVVADAVKAGEIIRAVKKDA